MVKRSRYGCRPEARALKVAATALFLMGLVWQHVQATRLGYQVERSRRRILALRATNGALRVELETVLAPARLSAAARQRMGMVLCRPDDIRVLPATPSPDNGAGFLRRFIVRTMRALTGPLQA